MSEPNDQGKGSIRRIGAKSSPNSGTIRRQQTDKTTMDREKKTSKVLPGPPPRERLGTAINDKSFSESHYKNKSTATISMTSVFFFFRYKMQINTLGSSVYPVFSSIYLYMHYYKENILDYRIVCIIMYI